jgi:hypothetical protein
MYDMDPNDPWDWTDYVRVGVTLVLGFALLVGIAYCFYIFRPDSIPDPILCCQCCCP